MKITIKWVTPMEKGNYQHPHYLLMIIRHYHTTTSTRAVKPLNTVTSTDNDNHSLYTYIMQPGEPPPRRIWLYLAFEVDVVTLLDVVDGQGWAELEGHHGGI